MNVFDDDVLVVRRRPLVLAAAAAPAAFGLAIASTGWPSAVALGVAFGWLGLGMVLYAWHRSLFARERPARARADARGLLVDGRLVIGSGRMRAGWVQPRPSAPPAVIILGRVARRIELVTRDVEQARALVRALGVDPARQSVAYWTMARPLGEPRTYARAAALVAMVFAFGIVARHVFPAAIALAVAALVVMLLGVTVPTHVTVGADGLLVRWLGSSRYVPWSSVAGIERFDGGVVLALEGKQWLTLRAPFEHERHQPELDALLERLRVAWRAQAPRRRQADEPFARLLCRAGGRTREWVAAMRAMAGQAGGYRAAALPSERLWRVVEDSSADRMARAGAALALNRSLDDAGRERLRVASESCAEPRLRVALSTFATPAGARASDEELAATIDAIEREGEDAQ